MATGRTSRYFEGSMKLATGVVSIVGFALAAVGCERASLAEDVELPAIGGRVFDHAHKPMTGCAIKVLDEQGDLLKSDKTGVDGSFSIEHKQCSKCMLQIVPSEDSGSGHCAFRQCAW